MTEENSVRPQPRSNEPWEVVFDTGAVDHIDVDVSRDFLPEIVETDLGCRYFMRLWCSTSFWHEEQFDFGEATIKPILCRHYRAHNFTEIELARSSLHRNDWLWRVEISNAVSSVTAYAVVRRDESHPLDGSLYRLIFTAPSPAEYTAFLLSVEH